MITISTEDQFGAAIQAFNDLNELANACHHHLKLDGDDLCLQGDGSIEYKVNTACRCHPEYERRYISREDFLKFVLNHNKQKEIV